MPYVGFNSIAATDTAKTVAALTIPATSTHAELQASVQPITYRMDGTTPTSGVGMNLAVADEPKLFTIEQIRNISFIRAGGVNGTLGVHYIGTRL
jgi:hypothetical protein